jgi:hypothetical protein
LGKESGRFENLTKVFKFFLKRVEGLLVRRPTKDQGKPDGQYF